jgi:hypothetical protein
MRGAQDDAWSSSLFKGGAYLYGLERVANALVIETQNSTSFMLSAIHHSKIPWCGETVAQTKRWVDEFE